jgi:hypothetical protein
MEPEFLLPFSQESYTDPYPEPDESSTNRGMLFLEHPFYYYAVSYVLVFIVASCVLPAMPISSSLIW